MSQERHPGPLPQYYGQQMPDGTLVESPNFPLGSHASRDTLLRLPIQPSAAHVQHQDQEAAPRISTVPDFPAVPEKGSSSAGRARARTTRDSSRWLVPLAHDQEQDGTYHEVRSSSQVRRRDLGSMRHQPAYVEDYSDEEERPRAYRRPVRRHTRPPPSHGRVPVPVARYPSDQGRSSVDGWRPSYEYESDTPSKSRIQASYGYGSEEDDAYRRPRAAYGDGGRRGPPRTPPTTEDVMRLPWTLWMSSNLKNRWSPRARTCPYPYPHPQRIATNEYPLRPADSPFPDRALPTLHVPEELQHRVLILS